MAQRVDLIPQVRTLKAEGMSFTDIGGRLGISRDAARRLHLKDSGLQPTADSLVLDAAQLGDIDGMLRERGMNPDEWVVVSATVNKWDSGDGENRQLKFTVRRKLSAAFIQPATVKPVKQPGRVARIGKRDARLFFVYGDDQRPHVDRGFDDCKLQWIVAHQPDVILDLGDGPDAPSLSGHKVNPAMAWPLQECVDDTAQADYAKRCAAPGAVMVKLADNHFHQRLVDYQMAQARALYGVHPASVAGLAEDLQPLVSVQRMLRCDEIGVKYVAPPGDTHYAESHYEIVPGELVAIHGYRTGSNLGKKFVDDYGCSVIYGHAHQQDVYVTDQNRRGVGVRKRRYALGVGCGAIVQGGGGFAPGANWQNCALTVSVFPDGGWTWDYMGFEDGVMRWRDERYEARESLAVAA